MIVYKKRNSKFFYLLRKYYSRRKKDKTLKPYNQGELVVVYCENEYIWLRGRITKLIKGDQNDDLLYEV